ncbi:MAG: MG2 domain-containing protein [Bacteroidota bacterium]
MRTLPSSIQRLAIFSLVSLLLFACKKENTPENLSQELSAYVYAYSSGMISKAAPIKVQFSQNVVDAEAVGTAATNVFGMQPKVDGEAIWEDEQTLAFQPEGMLASGRAYQVSVQLDQIFQKVPDALRTFRFEVETRKQSIDVEMDNVVNVDADDWSAQRILATIFTTDVASAKELEEAIAVEQSDKTLPIDIQSYGSGLRHDLVVNGVERETEESIVKIKWNEQALGTSGSGFANIGIAGLNEFKVMYARIMQEDEQYILLNFSDPLQRKQELEGLIDINDYDGNLRYVIDNNQVRIYTDRRLVGTREIQIRKGIKNKKGKRLTISGIWELNFEQLKPKVRMVGSGVIIPDSEGMLLPFEAVSLNAVEVEIFKIFNNNILQFLQKNELSGGYNPTRVGRVVYQGKVDLADLTSKVSSNSWTRYALNLDNFIEKDPQAIYQVRIGFRKEYATFYCGEDSENTNLNVVNNEEETGEIKSFWDDYYGFYGYYNGYSWRDRDNPCKKAYYNRDVFAKRNMLASNLGIIAKSASDQSLMVVVSDLRTAQPLSGIEVEVFDYQQQSMGIATTQNDGTVLMNLPRKAFVVVAKKEQERGYLRMEDGDVLSLSRFDVSGAQTQSGMKGYLYGERGVWRPGDSIYLNFVLSDEEKALPSNYPVTLELRDSRGQLQEKLTRSEHLGGIYDFQLATAAEAPTGDWLATVKAGNANFTKTLKVETVKPNRLKVNLDFGGQNLASKEDPVDVELQVNWLYGAPASNLRTKVELDIQSVNTTFDNYNNYEFDDPARQISSESSTVFDQKINENGSATFRVNLMEEGRSPGRVRADFTARAFEPGGDFSTRSQSVLYDPYTSYAGIAIPKNKYDEKRFNIDQEEALRMVLLNADGKPLSNQNLSVGLYRVEWRWWWEQGGDNLTRYNSSQHYDAMQQANVTTDAKGEATWDITVNNWGRYLVRVCDTKSGHCSGDFFYAGYPWYDADGQNRDAAAMIAFSTDKDNYNVGETVQLNVPASENGYAFISIEDGSQVIQSFWKSTTAGDNIFEIKTTPDMAPNVYAHVSLIQPHGQQNNDLPIRMYGIASILVDDEETILQPQMAMPDNLQPEQKFSIEVSEANNKSMAYTIAIVDEGLLDLTNFETPNPYDLFYAKEALGVQTWDMYNDVVGSYAGALDRVLSVGGDGVAEIDLEKQKTNRFPPVVRHLGPFYLKKGKAKHDIQLPNYVGSVRAMVVAANTEGAYGSTEKTVAIKSPLMVLPTLPRVLGVQENVRIPVTIFADNSKVKNVTVSVLEANGYAKIREASQSIRIGKEAEQTIYFDMQLPDRQGNTQFIVEAKGGGLTTRQAIDIEVRNPNSYTTDVQSVVLEAQDNHTFDLDPFGVEGSNSAVMEVSNIPPLDLGERLRYLIRYPHGCVEQTTSSAFPQLYVDQLMEIKEEQRAVIPQNIAAAIQRLKQFQLVDGSFSYWPGSSNYNEWGTNYAGHFLLEAKAKGYAVPSDMLNRWKKFQRRIARNWSGDENTRTLLGLTQSYRLYTLALAGAPDLSAMNRMREMKNLSRQARWRLAAAYAIAGKSDAANKLIDGASVQVATYRQLAGTYGSDLRDQAMIAESMVAMEDKKRAASLVQDMARQLSQSPWYSTQETAYVLLAISKFVGEQKSKQQFTFSYALNKQQTDAGSNHPVMQVDIPINRTRQVSIKNTHNNILYARLLTTGQPPIGQETSIASDLDISVRYTDADGNDIDESSLAQGTDFIAEVTIQNPGTRGIRYEELALTQIFPSGWEIINTRVTGQSATPSSTAEYQDIRDDRVYTYFDLEKGVTKTYRIRLNTAYEGRYYLPGVHCAAMYDNDIQARTSGMWVNVVRVGEG